MQQREKLCEGDKDSIKLICSLIHLVCILILHSRSEQCPLLPVFSQFKLKHFTSKWFIVGWLSVKEQWNKNHSLTFFFYLFFYPPLHALSLLSVCFPGLLCSSDGCGRNNDPTDGFIRGRLRQPAGGSFRGNQELKRQELCVKRRLTASDAASLFSCLSNRQNLFPRNDPPGLDCSCVCVLLHPHMCTLAYVTHPRFAFVHCNTYAWGLKHVRSFWHVNELELALLATCVLMC